MMRSIVRSCRHRLGALVCAVRGVRHAGRRAGRAARCCPTSPSSTTSRARRSCRIDVTQKVAARRAARRALRGRSVLRVLPPLRPDPARRAARPSASSEQQSVGSGFIISRDGYLITNAHVVDGADEVTVKLTDKREFKAKVIGADKRTDVAVLKIDAKDLPKVTIGDPDKLKVGEWVVAIGKPFGLENTMTAGIVSAKGRDLPQENLVPFIQTDVAINPGNSGGPLFNLQGRGRRHQLADLLAHRRLHGALVRDPDRRRDEHGRAAQGQGPRDARAHRRADPGSEQGDRRIVRTAEGRAARWSTRSRRAARRTRPASRPATSSSRSTAAR